jgi:hypothetical protein
MLHTCVHLNTVIYNRKDRWSLRTFRQKHTFFWCCEGNMQLRFSPYLTVGTWHLNYKLVNTIEGNHSSLSAAYKMQFRTNAVASNGACGGAVGWGTVLQAGRSPVQFPMVSMEFFIYIILPATLWPWGRLRLQKKCFLGGKSSWPYHLHVIKFGSLNLLEPSRPVIGIALPLGASKE